MITKLRAECLDILISFDVLDNPNAQEACVQLLETALKAPYLHDQYQGFQRKGMGFKFWGETNDYWFDALDRGDVIYDQKQPDSSIDEEKVTFYKDLLWGQLGLETKQRLFSPSAEHLNEKNDIVVVDLNWAELGEFLSQRLGPSYDSHLKSLGHKYHRAPPWNTTKDYRFLVACTPHEIPGILGYCLDDQSHSVWLSYISVVNGFLQKGISKKLLKEIGEISKKTNRLLCRSSPSSFALERGIVQSYTREIEQNGVLHATTGTRAEFLLLELLNCFSYTELVERKLNVSYQRGVSLGEETKLLQPLLDLMAQTKTPKIMKR